MATFRLCHYCGDLHDLADWPDNHRDPDPARSALPAPMVILDTMAPVQSMLDGRIYDSKHVLRETYRRGGVEEVGNEKPQMKARKRIRDDRRVIGDSLRKAEARVARGDVTEKTKALMLSRPGTKAPKKRRLA